MVYFCEEILGEMGMANGIEQGDWDLKVDLSNDNLNHYRAHGMLW